jgi:hypothetical protein
VVKLMSPAGLFQACAVNVCGPSPSWVVSMLQTALVLCMTAQREKNEPP